MRTGAVWMVGAVLVLTVLAAGCSTEERVCGPACVTADRDIEKTTASRDDEIVLASKPKPAPTVAPGAGADQKRVLANEIAEKARARSGNKSSAAVAGPAKDKRTATAGAKHTATASQRSLVQRSLAPSNTPRGDLKKPKSSNRPAAAPTTATPQFNPNSSSTKRT